MKAKRIILFCVSWLATVAAAVALALCTDSVAAHAEEVELGGDGNRFTYRDESYGAGEVFVYSSTVYFDSGAAAGLVFGGKDDACFVFNVDRAANRTKLIYFYTEAGEQKDVVLKDEFYVGTDAINDGEKEYVVSRTQNIDKVYLKVVVNADGSAEFYADGIQRFVFTKNGGSATAEKLILNELTPAGDVDVTINYDGGRIGYNCFNASVRFVDTLIGKTDFANYGELYRNQFHFSQYAHWNNDPNGLVYYNGYYHLYFQHNPYGNTWDAMHWGHARSTDLVHWELLPIALVPDRDLAIDEGGRDHGIGAMWSGSARVYHKGDSTTIDGRDWFGDTSDKKVGDALGLIAYYTRFDDGGNRHQILAFSNDGGLSWHKSDNIPSTVSRDLNNDPITGGSWRDPKVFDISGISGVGDYKWGMALTDMEDNMLFFLKSKDLVSWEHAGSYFVYRPECPDVVSLKADDGATRTVITFTSRYYVVCTLAYEGGNIVMRDESGNKINRLELNSEHLRVMDYGVDSYAAQTFYIDGNSDSAYKNKTVGLSWFSGVPNDDRSIESGVLQTARKVWNGGGMTIPVEYGLKKIGSDYTLTTKPITVDNQNFTKTAVESVDKIDGHSFEISATVENFDAKPVYFRINKSADGAHYTEIGWNATDGYYVDRTHTEDAGINFPKPNYACKYSSGMGKSNTTLDFYILSDNGGAEVYCDGFTVPFYVLTFASPHSVGAQFYAEADGAKADITVNEIGTVWREASDETLINLSTTRIDLSVGLGETRKFTAYALGKEISYELVGDAEVATLEKTVDGGVVTAKKAGSVQIKVTAGESSRLIDVTVHSGEPDSDAEFVTGGIVSGDWFESADGITGEQAGGDGFILSTDNGDDFVYSARMSINGAAAALVFRAKADMSDYLIANYDKPGKVIKLWSPRGEIARANNVDIDPTDIEFIVSAVGKEIRIAAGGVTLTATLGEDEPTEGLFGLNVCAGSAVFSSIAITGGEHSVYSYDGNGALAVNGAVSQTVTALYNRTLGNVEVSPQFYTVDGRTLTLLREYFTTLAQTGEYVFSAACDKIPYDFTVNVTAIPQAPIYSYDGSGALAVNVEVTRTVTALYNRTLGNVEVSPQFYTVDGRTLTLSREYFTTFAQTGEYVFSAVCDKISYDFKVNVTAIPKATPSDMTIEKGCNAVLYVGNVTLGEISLNGAALGADSFTVVNGMLTVNSDCFVSGENTLAVANFFEITVTVNEVPVTNIEVDGEDGTNVGLIVGIAVPIGILALVGIAVAVLFILDRKKHIFEKFKRKKIAADRSETAMKPKNNESTEDGAAIENNESTENEASEAEENGTEVNDGGND